MHYILLLIITRFSFSINVLFERVKQFGRNDNKRYVIITSFIATSYIDLYCFQFMLLYRIQIEYILSRKLGKGFCNRKQQPET